MAQVVPLNWRGSFVSWGGPLASGDTHSWWAAGGEWGQFNRFYLFSVFGDGSVPATFGVRNIRHRRTAGGGDETNFEIHNYGSDAPAYYYFYMAWTDPINV